MRIGFSLAMLSAVCCGTSCKENYDGNSPKKYCFTLDVNWDISF